MLSGSSNIKGDTNALHFARDCRAVLYRVRRRLFVSDASQRRHLLLKLSRHQQTIDVGRWRSHARQTRRPATRKAKEGAAARKNPPPWSETRFVARPRIGPTRSFDLHPDGNRFALARATQTEAKEDTLTFFFNFIDELRRAETRPI